MIVLDGNEKLACNLSTSLVLEHYDFAGPFSGCYCAHAKTNESIKTLWRGHEDLIAIRRYE